MVFNFYFFDSALLICLIWQITDEKIKEIQIFSQNPVRDLTDRSNHQNPTFCTYSKFNQQKTHYIQISQLFHIQQQQYITTTLSFQLHKKTAQTKNSIFVTKHTQSYTQKSTRFGLASAKVHATPQTHIKTRCPAGQRAKRFRSPPC